MVKIINHIYRFKRGTAEDWKASNIILQQGEPGFEYDTGKLKIGDGFSSWRKLKYINPTLTDEILKIIQDNTDQRFNPKSSNAQSGKAVAEAIKNIEISNTPGQDGFSPIVEINENPEGYELKITDIEGSKKVLIKNGKDGEQGLQGASGRGIKAAAINNAGELLITYSDDKDENLGKVVGNNGTSGKDGISVAKIEINTQGELIITLSDNSVQNLGTVVGAPGEQGSTGSQGPKGEKGDTGPQGPKGDKGDTGSQGIQGVGINNSEINEQGELIITYTDNNRDNLGRIVGNDGEDGLTPYINENGTWQIGNIDTGVKATGEKGEPGPKGETGSSGLQGEKGADGTSVTITNIVESAIDGGNNTVTFSNGQTITIKNGNKGSDGEKGDTGATGPQGQQGPKGDTGSQGPKGDPGYTPVKGTDYFTTNDKKELVNNLIKETNINVIPDYVIAEAESAIDRVIAAQGSRTFTFAAISDLHYGNNNYTDGILHATQALKYIDSRLKLDAVAVLGDYTDGYPASDLTNAFNDFKTINSVLNDLRFAPNLRQQGNHDYYADNLAITNRFIQAYSDNVIWGDKVGGYYYKDFEEYKLRIISLNTVEQNNENIDCSDAQYKWFVESLNLSAKENHSDWQILILSHHPLDWYSNDATSANNYWYQLPKILYGYKNGLNSANASGYGTSFTPAFDFSQGNNKAKIIGNIHGHIHNLLVAPIYLNIGAASAGNVGVYRMATPEACIGRENQYDTPWKESISYPKTINTVEDTSFVIYCVDLDTNIINAICYGAGYDRVLNYLDGSQSISYSITNNLTNVTSNNATAHVKENGNYTATLTANIQGDMIVMVKMGGVDITSTAYQNGIVTIDNVTGNVVITAYIKTEQKTTYSITNNLIRVLNNNMITSVDEGQFYSATLSANYDDEIYANNATITCKVTMGGTDITSEVYNDNTKTINISSVNGDIQIDGYAYVNMLKLAVDSSGNPYNNGQGWKANYRLNSSGTETAQTGVEVTGFIPVSIGDVVKFDNMYARTHNSGDHGQHQYLAFYDASKTKLDSAYLSYLSGGNHGVNSCPGFKYVSAGDDYAYGLLEFNTKSIVEWTNSNNKWSNSANMAYFRISAEEITDDSIITINEEIL